LQKGTIDGKKLKKMSQTSCHWSGTHLASQKRKKKKRKKKKKKNPKKEKKHKIKKRTQKKRNRRKDRKRPKKRTTKKRFLPGKSPLPHYGNARTLGSVFLGKLFLHPPGRGRVEFVEYVQEEKVLFPRKGRRKETGLQRKGRCLCCEKKRYRGGVRTNDPRSHNEKNQNKYTRSHGFPRESPSEKDTGGPMGRSPIPAGFPTRTCGKKSPEETRQKKIQSHLPFIEDEGRSERKPFLEGLSVGPCTATRKCPRGNYLKGRQPLVCSVQGGD